MGAVAADAEDRLDRPGEAACFGEAQNIPLAPRFAERHTDHCADLDALRQLLRNLIVELLVEGKVDDHLCNSHAYPFIHHAG